MDCGPWEPAVLPTPGGSSTWRVLHRLVTTFFPRTWRRSPDQFPHHVPIYATPFNYKHNTVGAPLSDPEFELGLELDSAEVRGILIHEGEECGRVVFDFLN